MEKTELIFSHNHLFFKSEGHLFLIDTGAPFSFSEHGLVSFGGDLHQLNTHVQNVNAETISKFIGIEIKGLVGANILNQYDLIFDIKKAELSFSKSQLNLDGDQLIMESRPIGMIIEVFINGEVAPMVFDTGAQYSFWLNEGLLTYPKALEIHDFHPSIGAFSSQTYRVPFTLGENQFEVNFGSLPTHFSMMLTQAGIEGVIGNEIMIDRKVGYFPKRSKLVLG